ncbi:MAG: hypothetical protein JWM37_581 [Candidatus Saccharibacteria bacterium]|nr:hypothetical protein [Candidatus Saccharibacteria bacterium]
MTFDINFRAGEYLVDPLKWEVPHLMEHILLGANQLIPKARDFQAELEKNGAYSNATTGVYDITYEAECADFEWDRVLQLLLVAITKPLFLKDEYEAEYGNVAEELTARANNHSRRLSLALRKEFGFLAKTDRERLGLMANVSLEDVQQHYHDTHQAGNMRFCFAGNITPERVREIEAIMTNISLDSGTTRFALPTEMPRKLPKPLVIKNQSVKNIYFFLDAFMERRMSDAESDALNLVNTMFTETLYSKILGAARERGLVYDMGSGLNLSKHSSNWWFGAQVSPRNAKPLFDIMNHEILEVLHGNLPEEEIDAAKQYALGRFQRSGQTVGATAGGYSHRYFFDDHINDYYQMPERIAKVDRDAIVKITREMFTSNIWGLGVLGKTDAEFAAQLNEQASVLWEKPQLI